MQDNSAKLKAKLRGKAKNRAINEKGEKVSRIQKLAKAIGNDEIVRRIQQGNASRDMMLAYLCEHLRQIRTLQTRELELTHRTAHWDWWRDVADDHKPWNKKPEPKRWAQSAHLYEEAAKKLCKGELGTGTRLLEKAIAEEQKQVEQSTDLLNDNDLGFDSRAAPTFLLDIVDNAACGACALPSEVALAQEIMNVTTEVEDPMNRKRRRDPWWTLEEEEEEDEDAAG